MPQLLTAVFLLLACIPAARSGVTTVSELSALEGRSIAAPCHYDPALAAHVKYWCWGIFKDTCTMVARTDTAPSDPRVSIVDDPAQQVFTVTMADLTEDQAGWYHCGAEEGGIWSKDPSAAVYLSVVHGMSVVNNRLDGEEGGSVAVDCLYSKRYRDIKKSWCRSGDPGSCQFTGTEGIFDSPSVTIADDRVGAFTVNLSKLRMADAGWYWCGVGTQKTAVQVLVTPRPSTTAVPVTSTPAGARSPEHISLESQLAHRGPSHISYLSLLRALNCREQFLAGRPGCGVLKHVSLGDSEGLGLESRTVVVTVGRQKPMSTSSGMSWGQ
uniref:Polymeric immunoglobulin receptor n=1 Tax=Gadus morhua TaxID=8049 RepID=A0A8C5CAV6_GADMO